MRQAIVAGNWKMNGSLESIEQLVSGIKSHTNQHDTTVIVFPPSIYIDRVAKLLHNTPVQWGAQNVSANESGAYTGEISAAMLKDFACKYVLVGHSERRQLFKEDNTLIALKLAQAQRYGLIPILCVGETLAEREADRTEIVLAEQLAAVFALEGGVDVLRDAVIAYEPVWAIGTGKTATPEQAQTTHRFIRNEVAHHSKDVANNVSILYGGSVKASNARELFAMPDIDGGLIGGASLDAESFVDIIKCIN